MAKMVQNGVFALADSNKIAFESRIGPHHAGKSLVGFLTDRFTYFNQSLWLEKIAAGDVLLNGLKASGQENLGSGDSVKYLALIQAEPPVPRSIPVIYEDEDLLIVNKPAHIPVHPSGRYLRNTLIHVLKAKRPKESLLFLAHRLDRETSGLCVLTKTHLAKEKVYWQFFRGEVEKTYEALVWGAPNKDSGLIDAAMGLGTPAQTKIRIKQVIGGKDSKTAKTRYRVLKTHWIQAPTWSPPPWPRLLEMCRARESKGLPAAPPWPVTRVELKPLTGRTNQLRVHMAHLGCGLVGDKLYDPDESIFLDWKEQMKLSPKSKEAGQLGFDGALRRRLVLDAHALHAKSLKFRHPRSGRVLEFSAPPPPSWTRISNSNG